MAGSVGAVAFGIAGGIVVGTARGIHPPPIRLRFRLQVRVDIQFDLVRRLFLTALHSWEIRIWLVAWACGGAAFGVAAAMLIGSSDAIVFGLAGGVVVGVGVLAVGVVMIGFSARVDPTEMVSPGELLRTERRTSLGQALMVGWGAQSCCG